MCGTVLAKLGRLKEALKQNQHAQSDISKAVATINQGLKNSPDNLLLNYNRAMFLYKNGRKDEAIEQLRYTIRIAPDKTIIQKKLDQWLGE
ncbi:MAG: hypothetical protein P8X42_01620 [Calditrichaceae bacterium]